MQYRSENYHSSRWRVLLNVTSHARLLWQSFYANKNSFWSQYVCGKVLWMMSPVRMIQSVISAVVYEKWCPQPFHTRRCHVFLLADHRGMASIQQNLIIRSRRRITCVKIMCLTRPKNCNPANKACGKYPLMAKFTGSTWGPPGSCRLQNGPM